MLRKLASVEACELRMLSNFKERLVGHEIGGQNIACLTALSLDACVRK